MKLPSHVPSVIGPVPVLHGRKTDLTLNRGSLLGAFSSGERTISIHSGCPDAVTMSVLGHEVMHLVLEDAGLGHLMDSKLQEAICDAYGTWFTAAVQSGSLSLK